MLSLNSFIRIQSVIKKGKFAFSLYNGRLCFSNALHSAFIPYKLTKIMLLSQIYGHYIAVTQKKQNWKFFLSSFMFTCFPLMALKHVFIVEGQSTVALRMNEWMKEMRVLFSADKYNYLHLCASVDDTEWDNSPEETRVDL